MKLIILTDVHANLPALQAALQAIQHEGYDALFHTGDAIGIGPFPAETLQLLLETPRSEFVMGNHDAWFAHGLPQPRPAWMSEGEEQHHHWVHQQLDPGLRSVVAGWPYSIQLQSSGLRVALLHYGLDASGLEFLPIVPTPSAADLDQVFEQQEAELVFYGHDHAAADLQGRARYVSPGSLGCFNQAVARYAVLEVQPSGYRLEQRAVPYDAAPLRQAFAERGVPEAAFIWHVFFGGRDAQPVNNDGPHT